MPTSLVVQITANASTRGPDNLKPEILPIDLIEGTYQNERRAVSVITCVINHADIVNYGSVISITSSYPRNEPRAFDGVPALISNSSRMRKESGRF